MDIVEEGLGKVVSGGGRIFREFKNFISKGSAIDLAIGVVIGASFNTVVQALVKNVITPVVSLFGSANFDDYRVCLKHIKKSPGCISFGYGAFVTQMVAFLITAASVFFFVVLPLNRMRERKGVILTERPCPYCTMKISVAAKRCPYCTSDLGEGAGSGSSGTAPAKPPGLR